MNERGQLARQLCGRIDARQAGCAVIGLGFIGSTLMDAIVDAGFRVYGLDRSAGAVERFRAWMRERHPDAGGRWSAGCDPAALRGAEVVMVAVRAAPRAEGGVDLEPLRAAAGILKNHPVRPRLVLVESTVPCGTTRCFAQWAGAGTALFVAHSPERLSVGHDRAVLRRVPHLVGGVDTDAGLVGSRFLATLCGRVVQVSSPEVSELSKLLENAFLAVGIALSNEMTRIAHGIGIAAEEVCAAAATKPFGYHPFYPGPGMGGHCLGNDLQILLETAERADAASALLREAAAAAGAGPALVIRRLDALLDERALALRDGPVLLVGVGFKPGTGDTAETPAREIVRLLRGRGALVRYLDALVPEFAVDGQPVPRLAAAELGGARFTATLVLAGDRTVPLERLAEISELVLDARGGSPEPRPGGVYVL